MKTGTKTRSTKSNDLHSSLSMSGTESSPGDCGEMLMSRIAEAAYYKAQARGFEPGHEMEDWLNAEKEVTQ